MGKVYHFLIALLCLGSFNAVAQPVCESITHTSGAAVLSNGVTVTVSGTSSNTSSYNCPAPPGPVTVAPYQIGRNVSNYYDYVFAPSITHAKMNMVRIHDNDTIQFYRNGVAYPLAAADVTATIGGCGAGVGNHFITTDGRLTSQGTSSGAGTAVFVTIPAAPFDSIKNIRVEHQSRSIDPLASDVVYDFCALKDSCSESFEAKVDSPACSGRDIQFTATLLPNTQYVWSQVNPLTVLPVNWSPSNTVNNPVGLNMNQGHNDFYAVVGVRGTCIYRDTVQLVVAQSPILGPITQAGPKCPGEDDTIRLKQIFLPAGGFVVGYGSHGRDTFDNTNFDLILKGIQSEDANKVYNIYAADLFGCISDTVQFSPIVKPDVKAAIEHDTTMEGCFQDTVIFINKSTSDSNLTIYSYWDFDDSSWFNPIDTSEVDSVKQTITHYYRVADSNWKDTSYYPRLYVTNGRCSDTVEAAIYINHPIRAYYNIVDEIYEMCQGKLVEFDADDSTFVKPGTIPIFKWDFKDGDSAFTINTSHVFNRAGEFYPTFIVEDYLGCKDSFRVKITVDSAGYINFSTDKEKVCVGEEITFIGEYSPYGYVTAIWNMADGVIINDSTKVHHSYREPGTYKVTFDVDYRFCDDVHYEGEYTVKPYPSVYIGEDTSLCMNGGQIHLKDLYNIGNPTGIKYQWNTPNKEKTSDVVIRHHGRYALTADLDGCIASDTIEVKKDCYIDIPNVFTPNGDGQGDYFLPRQILSSNVADFKMTIYNRWGKKVFETNSNNGRGWDGKLGGDDQPIGVYVYFIEVEFGNNVTERYQGNVTLLR